MKQNELNTLAQKINLQLMAGAVDTAKLVIDSNASLNSSLGAKLDAIHGALKDLKPKVSPPAPAAPRICRDCVHCVPVSRLKAIRMFRPDVYEMTYEHAKCARPTSPRADILVSGKNTDGYYCSVERESVLHAMCGREAKFYEAKP